MAFVNAPNKEEFNGSQYSKVTKANTSYQKLKKKKKKKKPFLT